MAGKDNLKPIQKGQLSHEEAKARGSKGGKKSVEVRREKKLLSQKLADYFGTKDRDEYFDAMMKRKDAVSLGLIKEAREATEGNKIKLASDEVSPLNITITPVKVKE